MREFSKESYISFDVGCVQAIKCDFLGDFLSSPAWKVENERLLQLYVIQGCLGEEDGQVVCASGLDLDQRRRILWNWVGVGRVSDFNVLQSEVLEVDVDTVSVELQLEELVREDGIGEEDVSEVEFRKNLFEVCRAECQEGCSSDFVKRATRQISEMGRRQKLKKDRLVIWEKTAKKWTWAWSRLPEKQDLLAP